MKTFVIRSKLAPVHTITVTIPDDGPASISSNLKDGEASDPEEVPRFDAAIDGIEALILGHAVAGIDVSSEAYIEGIDAAIGAVSNWLA